MPIAIGYCVTIYYSGVNNPYISTACWSQNHATVHTWTHSSGLLDASTKLYTLVYCVLDAVTWFTSSKGSNQAIKSISKSYSTLGLASLIPPAVYLYYIHTGNEEWQDGILSFSFCGRDGPRSWMRKLNCARDNKCYFSGWSWKFRFMKIMISGQCRYTMNDKDDVTVVHNTWRIIIIMNTS